MIGPNEVADYLDDVNLDDLDQSLIELAKIRAENAGYLRYIIQHETDDWGVDPDFYHRVFGIRAMTTAEIAERDAAQLAKDVAELKRLQAKVGPLQ